MKKIKAPEKTKRFIPNRQYAYQNLSSFFKDMEKRKLISKATYSILYHPLLLLSKTYNVRLGDSWQHITLNSDHIVLLAYIMGYITDKLGSEYFWGANSTIAKDLGVCVRTIQRRLKVLKDVGFIETDIEDCNARCIYVNFMRIKAEILSVTDAGYQPNLLVNSCKFFVQYFVKENWVEHYRQSEYAQQLLDEYLSAAGKAEIPDMFDFLFEKTVEILGIRPEEYAEKRMPLRQEYIKSIVNGAKKG